VQTIKPTDHFILVFLHGMAFVGGAFFLFTFSSLVIDFGTDGVTEARGF
jgi:hypothetical protein